MADVLLGPRIAFALSRGEREAPVRNPGRLLALMLALPTIAACAARDLSTVPPPRDVPADARTTTQSGITIAAIRSG
jgi:hypothetical protein